MKVAVWFTSGKYVETPDMTAAEARALADDMKAQAQVSPLYELTTASGRPALVCWHGVEAVSIVSARLPTREALNVTPGPPADGG